MISETKLQMGSPSFPIFNRFNQKYAGTRGPKLGRYKNREKKARELNLKIFSLSTLLFYIFEMIYLYILLLLYEGNS